MDPAHRIDFCTGESFVLNVDSVHRTYLHVIGCPEKEIATLLTANIFGTSIPIPSKLLTESLARKVPIDGQLYSVVESASTPLSERDEHDSKLVRNRVRIRRTLPTTKV